MAKRKKSDDGRALLDLCAEAGLLKRVQRSGWWVVGIDQPESVADHCFRCALLGYVLAKQERADTGTVVMMCLFNDLHEARINDSHKMASIYFDHKDAEERAFRAQIAGLPKGMRDELAGWRAAYNQQQSKESIIARDADILECLLQAKEYHDQGHRQAKLFFQKAPRFLRTRSSRRLWQLARNWDSSAWWQRVAQFHR